MANLREVRVRITSIKSTRQITSAMKMVSASKLRKGQNAILNLRPYETRLRQILANIHKQQSPEDQNVLCVQKPVKDVLVIIVAANKGLCGTFNANLLKKAAIHLKNLKAQNYNVKLWIIGKKAEDFFKKSSFEIEACHHDLIDTVKAKPAFEIAQQAMELLASGSYQKVDVIYNHFRNAARYDLIIEQLLPMTLTDPVAEESEAPSHDDFDYILEPSPKEIIEELLPKVIQTYFFRILLDSFASEQGARMTAMHQATDNATELLKNLTITYNKVRQASITNEIVEIVGGAEALNG